MCGGVFAYLKCFTLLLSKDALFAKTSDLANFRFQHKNKWYYTVQRMFEKLKRQLKETVQPGLQQSGNLLKITKLRSKVQLSSKNIVSFVLTTNEVYTN